MATTASTSDWQAKAAFMRESGALHAEWSHDGQLIRLTLGAAPSKATPTHAPASNKGPAQRLLEMHKKQFAASRFAPPAPRPVTPEAAVPRAVRAKQAAAAGGATKSKKRAS